MNSAGSAEQENAVYMESLEGKLNNLKSAWQDFARNTIMIKCIRMISIKNIYVIIVMRY